MTVRKAVKTEVVRDIWTEELVGERGAIRCVGKFVLSPRGKQNGDTLFMMIGSMFSLSGEPILEEENRLWHEMWACELIIIPKRKYSSRRTKKQQKEYKGERIFAGLRADQILCHDFGNPKMWGLEYFESGRAKQS